MAPVIAKKKPVKKDSPLKPQPKQEDLYALTEYKKENLRLHKQYTKTVVKLESEIASLKAQLSEAKKKSHLTITRVIIDPTDAKL